MSGHEIVVLGIPIPSDDPVFLATLSVHVPAGLICVVAGIVAMVSGKRPGRHPTAGAVYYWGLLVVFITATIVSVMRWADNYHLFVLGALAFATASLGRTARRQRWGNWLRLHMAGMGLSYILLLTAFYVDNGPNLPLWRHLPDTAFWVLPGALGAPILIHALLRHPLVRQT
jgi:FtsH-binding integral membrane protein